MKSHEDFALPMDPLSQSPQHTSIYGYIFGLSRVNPTIAVKMPGARRGKAGRLYPLENASLARLVLKIKNFL